MKAKGYLSRCRSVKLNLTAGYRRLFSPKNNNALSLSSGEVVLRKNESVGEHDTKKREELIVVLAGSGILTLDRRKRVRISKHTAVYVPAHTPHNVINTGKARLRYIYVTAQV